MTTAAFRDLLDEMADRMARCGTNVEKPEEDREYVRGWQAEMESFDRF